MGPPLPIADDQLALARYAVQSTGIGGSEQADFQLTGIVMRARARTAKVGAAFVEAATIGFRWRGAEYHLGVMRDIIENEIIGRPRTRTADRLRWHLAAFYWELTATFECTLQVISAHHKLGLERSDIRWASVESSLRDQGIQDELIKMISSVHKSDWFGDVRARRHNVTHWDAPFVQVLVVGGKVFAVGSVGQPDLLTQCSGHLERMKGLVDIAIKTLPTGHISFA